MKKKWRFRVISYIKDKDGNIIGERQKDIVLAESCTFEELCRKMNIGSTNIEEQIAKKFGFDKVEII